MAARPPVKPKKRRQYSVDAVIMPLKLKTEAATLTPETVTEAVEEIDWDDLCWCLHVPNSKREEILNHHPAKDHRKVLVDWWFSTDPAPSWRRIIARLDDWDHAAFLLDRIHCNAEPVQDPTFTLHNVTTTVASVEYWYGLGSHLGVPHTKCGSKEEMLEYFITIAPNASWQTLAEVLYSQQELAALERVTEYFQPQPDATLTVANLCSALEEVAEWNDLASNLRVPWLRQREIEEEHSNNSQRKRAMLTEWRNHHPAPSWMMVANALYKLYTYGVHGREWGKYHKVLQLVKEKYLIAADAQPTAQREPDISPSLSQPPPVSTVNTLIHSWLLTQSTGNSLDESSVVDIEYSDLEFKEKVGSGGYGTVSKGRWISKNEIVAIKMLMELVDREVRILSSLDHPSIIQYYGTATQNNVHYIVTEFAENGSIYDYIHIKHKQPLLSQILLWASQTAEGMVYLHQKDIIHRDLKSSNVVLTSALNAKICDLGSARSLQHTAQQTTAVGTYAWMAPEMLRREKVSKSCDVYSYGVLLFEMATQQLPFHDVLPLLVPSMTLDGKRPTIPETCDQHLADLVKCCWQDDAKARPSFKEILKTLNTVTNRTAN